MLCVVGCVVGEDGRFDDLCGNQREEFGCCDVIFESDVAVV